MVFKKKILYTLCYDSEGEDRRRMPWLTLWPAVLGMAI
jgi:hypothetical protein